MSQFIESIKISKGRSFNLYEHEVRMHRVMSEIFGIKAMIKLKPILKVPDTLKTELVKARVIYDTEIREIEYVPYTMRSINNAKIVIDDRIQYPFKSTDRAALTALYDQREDCDEIIIIKNGLVTDACNYNLIFQKKAMYFTPINPLLMGTQRQRLISKGIVIQKDIQIDEILYYDSIHFINAMTGMMQCRITVDQVVF